jgi:hypothetical protein
MQDFPSIVELGSGDAVILESTVEVVSERVLEAGRFLLGVRP